MRHTPTSAYDMTTADLLAALAAIARTSIKPAEMRDRIYLRMLGNRYLITEAAIGESYWNPHEMDLDALDLALQGRLDHERLTSLERATCEAAQQAIDAVREERWAAED